MITPPLWHKGGKYDTDLDTQDRSWKKKEVMHTFSTEVPLWTPNMENIVFACLWKYAFINDQAVKQWQIKFPHCTLTYFQKYWSRLDSKIYAIQRYTFEQHPQWPSCEMSHHTLVSSKSDQKSKIGSIVSNSSNGTHKMMKDYQSKLGVQSITSPAVQDVAYRFC